LLAQRSERALQLAMDRSTRVVIGCARRHIDERIELDDVLHAVDRR
jgi:hypothetical protein